jgi:hypothetical protein
MKKKSNKSAFFVIFSHENDFWCVLFQYKEELEMGRSGIPNFSRKNASQNEKNSLK